MRDNKLKKILNKLNYNINKLFKRKKRKNTVPAKKKCSPCEKRRLERERLARLNKSDNLKPCKHCPNQ